MEVFLYWCKLSGSHGSWRSHSCVEPLKLYLQKFREAMKGEKGIGGAVSATDGLSEELTEEAFSKQALSASGEWYRVGSAELSVCFK